MAFPQAMMHEEVWFDRPKYEEERENYQLFLNNNLSAKLSQTHYDQEDDVKAGKVATGAGSALINEIAKARDSIKQSLAGMSTATGGGGGGDSNTEVAELRKENKTLSDLVAKLAKQVAALEVRMVKLEGGKVPEEKGKDAKKKADDDDDFDLFDDDDDDEEEEESEAEKKRKEELLRKYHEKKSGKKQIIAKSSVLFDVKPWDDETDMVEMERLVRTIVMDGLVWGAGKLVPLAYGIKKLTILCVVEDDKVSTEELTEKIEAFEDYIQSADIAAFNKI